MADMDREMELLAPENLPLDLGELGTVKEAESIIPGVYETVIEEPETELNLEAYIVLRSAADISKAAKKHGLTDPGYPELLVYGPRPGGAGDGQSHAAAAGLWYGDYRRRPRQGERPHRESLYSERIKKSPGRLTRASGAQPPGGPIAIPLLY